MQEWQDIFEDKPLVQIFQNLPQAHQRVDADLHSGSGRCARRNIQDTSGSISVGKSYKKEKDKSRDKKKLKTMETHSKRRGLQAGGLDSRDEGVLYGRVVNQVGKRRDDVQAQLLQR